MPPTILTSPLLKLPAALRNRIYSLVVVKRFSGNPIIFNQETGPYFPETKDEHLQPALSQVCRQLRDEVLPIYYGENLFGIHIRRKSHFVEYDHPAFRRWLDVVREKNVNYITRFRFDVDLCGAAVQIHLLSVSPGYVVRRVTAKTEERERTVRAKVDAVLRPVNQKRAGDVVCVEDIRGFEEALFKWSQKDHGGKVRRKV